ncbi:uncharacterized protein C8R40DRAFT_853072 [Lentinula edodes]|uniref:uncharacterized protein n=1 Tax=Lentinula edodes TaxID=5353 RepID=UPI001E8D6978|nr:uncharacterized protein C8R40DRAFT_853072 [Lentinula edodes]KAH7868182.1 hypothetical protein C8R40DRAFT_853072 [Lentinula edodes]
MSLLSDIIQDAVKDVYASRYASLAASVIIVYDHLITLDNEFDLIWKSSWSIGKGLFIINRYYSLASVVANNYALFGTALTNSVGLRYYHWQGWTGLIACMIAETILQMRLYALYFLNKRILYLMVGSFILTSASAATIMSIAINQFQAETHLLPGLPCVALHVPSYFYSFWIPILAFETLLCILALIRGFRAHTESGYPVRSDSGKRLVSLLIRDSVCYYVVMFATYLTCLLVWVVNIDLLEVPIGFSIAFSCVLGNRVIFNVRKVNQEMKGSSETTTNDGTDKLDSLDDPEPLSDTLTDFEMAQLRSLRADTIEGAHLVI